MQSSPVFSRLGLSALCVIGALFAAPIGAQTHVSTVAPDGWARNSVNATIFRTNAVTSRDGTQVVGYYDDQARVVLAKRTVGTDDWETHVTQYTGHAQDAHNGVNLGIDGDGYLHVAWDHHGHPLRYAKSTEPFGLELAGKMSMVEGGPLEDNVTYPQFFDLPDGRLLFMYRDGSSGRGNLVVNRYDPSTQTWSRLHDKLIDGEDQRNAYWQACVDGKGGVHVAWVWRETWDVASNHDLAYAYSPDAGQTWVTSRGKPYTIPITERTSEYAMKIPQRHELINQTSIAADGNGRPYIATYFRPPNTEVPQFWMIHHDGNRWQRQIVGKRTEPFSLSGGGTKRIPISRPQIAIAQDQDDDTPTVHVVFRDQERGSVVTVATNRDPSKKQWELEDLTDYSVGMWEPAYDPALWRTQGELHLYVQKVEQADGEGMTDTAATPVTILQWTPAASATPDP